MEKQYDVRVVRIIRYTGKFSMYFINEEIDFIENNTNHVILPQLKKQCIINNKAEKQHITPFHCYGNKHNETNQ